MKKIVLVFVFAIFGYTANAQGVFKIGATAGVSALDAEDVADWVLGVDAYYMAGNEDSFLNFGGTVGFRNFFLSSDVVDDAQFLPIAGAARLKIFGILTGGVDIGYAVGVSDYLEGGLYYRPVLGIDIANSVELNASFESISDTANWGNFNVGILFQF